jgi:Tripartite tricarboxylate transporter TctB family
MISRRSLEVGTALLTTAFGATVAISSIDNGIRWSADGVEAGTFPFITGLVILAGSAINLARGCFTPDEIASSIPEFRRWLGLLLPAALYVALIPLLGMYAASAVYVFAAVIARGTWSYLHAAAFAVAFSVAIYVVFERLFQVSLPHGWLGAVMGW